MSQFNKGTIIGGINVYDEFTSQKQQSKTLQHGTNVLESDQTSPLNVEFHGDSKINLLGKIGLPYSLNGFTRSYLSAGTLSFADDSLQFVFNSTRSGFFLSDNIKAISGKNYLVILEVKSNVRTRVRAIESNLDSSTAFNEVVNNPSDEYQTSILKLSESELSSLDGFNLYFETYADNQEAVTNWRKLRVYEIDQDTYDKIGVSLDDADVERLFPYVDSVQHVRNPVVSVSGKNLLDSTPNFERDSLKVIAPYEFEILDSFCGYELEVNKNTDYFYSNDTDVTWSARGINDDGSTTSLIDYDKGDRGFNTGSYNTIRIYYRNYSQDNESLIKNPMLNLGTEPKPFVPRNPSYLYAETTLAGNNDKKDILSKNYSLNRWEKTKWFEQLDSFNSLTCSHEGSYEGHERIIIGLPSSYDRNIAYMTSDSGNVVYQTSWSSFSSSNNGFWLNNTETEVYINIPSDISSSYDLTTENGIKTLLSDENYFLTYQLAESVVEPVTVEGDLSIQGDAQVEVGEGVIVREGIAPQLRPQRTDSYYLNTTEFSEWWMDTKLKNKAKSILAIYKNGDIDTDWVITNDSAIGYGNCYASIKSELFDPNATYTVTYEILDKHDFTTNLNEVIATFQSSLKSSLQQVVGKQSDQGTTISIHTNQIIDILARLKAGGL